MNKGAVMGSSRVVLEPRVALMLRRRFVFLLCFVFVLFGAYSGRVLADCATVYCSSSIDSVWGKYKPHSCQTMPCNSPDGPPGLCMTEICSACGVCKAGVNSQCPVSQQTCDLTQAVMCVNQCSCN